MSEPVDLAGASCPLPIFSRDQIVMGHGSGGLLSAELLSKLFLPAYGNETLSALEDQAVLERGPGRLALSIDAFVVHPPIFPGGDIGRLAVCGTINDLAVGGARPRALAAAFILEEGLELSLLAEIAASMGEACRAAGVELVTGDTKVVDRGKGDKLYITTAGVGWVPEGRSLSIAAARPGDRVLVSGFIGDHGAAILSAREGLEFETELRSDCAALHELCEALIEACPGLRGMRDPTRGGLASALNEMAQASGAGVELDESALPIRPAVRGACELLGLDPLYVACEGRLVAAVAADEAERALAALRGHPLGRDAAVIGRVTEQPAGQLVLKTVVGGARRVPLLAGEALPRIC